MPLIEVHKVSKTFTIPSVRKDTVRDRVTRFFRRGSVEQLAVLQSINFTVGAGETLGIMGHNGSGKSTLLKILCGIYHPDAGSVRVFAPLTPILELGVGWNPELDAVDNILLIGTMMGLRLGHAKAAVDGILAFAGVERFARLELKHFSSGMAARLAYAVAFSAVREILVLDEVFAVGDAEFRTRCEARFAQLRSAGHTIVMVSHDPSAVAALCDRALVLEEGRIVLEDTGPRVARAYQGRFAARRQGAAASA